MKVAHLDRAFTIIAMGIGLFVVASAWNYGIYANGVPGPGFFPAIAGAMMALLAAGLALRDLRGRSRLAGEIRPVTILAIAGVTASILAVVYLAGMTGMALVTIVATMAIGFITEEEGRRGKGFVLRLAATSIGVVVLCHVLFGTVVGIPLIEGPFGF